jgi:hypothetical protein
MSQSNQSRAAAVRGSGLVDDAKALGEKITAVVGPAPALTQSDIQRSVKLRKGGAPIVQAVAAMSDKFGLVVPSLSTATMVDQINQAEALIALHKELVSATKHVADVIFLAQSKSWNGATTHYSVLRRLARTDGEVAKTLLPVVQFFAARSDAVEKDAKASRGGARKGSEKAKAHRASKRAEVEAILAKSESAASAAGDAPKGANGVEQ